MLQEDEERIKKKIKEDAKKELERGEKVVKDKASKNKGNGQKISYKYPYKFWPMGLSSSIKSLDGAKCFQFVTYTTNKEKKRGLITRKHTNHPSQD